MPQERPDGASVPGKDLEAGHKIPQTTVKPGTGDLGQHGPRDWDDLVPHTGEARGVADSARSSLQPDAPTVPAAERGQEPERDLSTLGTMESSGQAPD